MGWQNYEHCDWSELPPTNLINNKPYPSGVQTIDLRNQRTVANTTDFSLSCLYLVNKKKCTGY